MLPCPAWTLGLRRFRSLFLRHVVLPGKLARWVAVSLVALGLSGGSEVQGQMTVGMHPIQPFPAHIPRPIKVDIGFYLIDFARINGREETFDLQGYLNASWVDPSLALKPGEHSQDERRFPTDALWTPNYEFTNAAEQVKIQNEAALIVDDDGRIHQRFRFTGKFAWPMDLRRFPFDSQDLTILIEPFERQNTDLQFVVNQPHIGRLATAFVADWRIHEVSAKVIDAAYPSFGRTAARLVVEIAISRQATFYFWRVLIPMTLLVMMSWVVYLFEPTNLQPLISTTVAILMNVILFNFSIDFALPKVSYLTFIDAYAVTCLVFMLANMLCVTAIHLACLNKGADAAQVIQRRALSMLPLAFLASILSEAWFFLG